MRYLAFCTVFLAIIALTSAQVTLDVYESDGVTLFDNRNIRAGTELKLIVSSDSNDLWSGGVFLDSTSRDLGYLSGSGYDPNTRDWANSHFSDAGSESYVYAWEDSLIQGFDLFTSREDDANSGNWFVIDYIALEPGEPNVGFYEHDVSWTEPNAFVFLHQVPTADYNTDGVVNFLDYSLLASCWLEEDCTDPNGCLGADMDGDAAVDVNDLFLFADYWLWGMSAASNQSGPETDPNLIYSIIDANGLSEISMAVGDSVTLYVDANVIDANNAIWAFEIEVDISEPNLGSIDNTVRDPNNPPGEGTARILAGPYRTQLFDYWGPGLQQQEGILLKAASISGTFDNGHFASFVYTAQAAGDVILNIYHYDSVIASGEVANPTLESIVIHQGELLGGESMMMSSLSMDAMEATEQSTPTLSTEEMIQALEEIWEQTPEMEDDIDRKTWKEFLRDLEELY